MGWGVFGDLGGAIKGAAKAVGGDIVRGIKGAGKGIYKGVDKFDDLIRLKEISQISQFIPGPHQPFAKGLSMLYGGSDVFKATKEGNPLGVLLAGAQMYGSNKLGNRGGFSLEGYGKENILPTLRTGAKAFAGPVASRYLSSQNQKPRPQPMPNFSLSPTVGQQQGGRQNPMEIIKNPYTTNQRLPQFASGGMAGIPRLPDNFEGYIDKPHIVSLGERGTEVVVPLWKLMQQTRRS